MTDKEKYNFIDHVVHLTLFVEDRLLNEHGGDYSGLEEDGIDSNEYYRIITERVINILKKNNKYLQEEPVSNSDWLTELQEKLDNATPEQLEELWNKHNCVDEEDPVDNKISVDKDLFENIRKYSKVLRKLGL